MKEIKLTQGKVALVDDDDFNRINANEWFAIKKSNTYYAVRSVQTSEKRIRIFMHREIMNTPQGLEVDHIDHDGLNCQKSNMRNCTHEENTRNKRTHGKSKYQGVSFFKGMSRACIRYKGILMYLGQYKTEEEAARVYDKKAKELFGQFANLNFK